MKAPMIGADTVATHDADIVCVGGIYGWCSLAPYKWQEKGIG